MNQQDWCQKTCLEALAAKRACCARYPPGYHIGNKKITSMGIFEEHGLIPFDPQLRIAGAI